MSREREAESEENHVSREREAESEEGGSAVAERAHDRSFRAPDRVLVVERDHAQDQSEALHHTNAHPRAHTT